MLKEFLKNNKYFLFYTVVAVVVFGVIYLPILFEGKMYMYMDIGADTYGSYWPSLSYCATLLKDFKLWDMSLGLGASTMIQVAYFLVDPFNWITFLLPPFNMDIGIYIALCLKYIILCIAAYKYLGKMTLKGWPKVLASLCLVFSGWFVGWGQYYNYATMFVFFIVILYFFECWLQDGKWLGYVLSLAWLAMMTVYYCYMTLLFLAVYYMFRRFSVFAAKEYKAFCMHGLKTIGLCVAGIGISSVVFIPNVFDLLGSPRVGASLVPNLSLASANEYASFLYRSLSNNILGINGTFYGYANWYECPFIYVGIISFYMIPLAFKKKNVTRTRVIAGILVLLCIVFPHFFAIILNAFSTISYRWTYLFIPVFALGIGLGATELEKESESKIFKIVYIFINALIAAYAVYLLTIQEEAAAREVIYSIAAVLVAAALYFIILEKKWKKKSIGTLILIIVCAAELACNGVVSVQFRSLIDADSKEQMNYFDASTQLIEYVKTNDPGFYRINKKYAQIDLNDSMIQDYRGEKYYSSILTDSYWNLQNMFDLRVKNSNYFYGFDDKQSLRNINCGKYMISTSNRQYYGYNQIAENDNRYLYENTNNIGFGFTYHYYITESEFEKLSQYEQQNVIYQACVINDEDAVNIYGDIPMLRQKVEIELNEIPYEVTIEDNGQETIKLEKSNSSTILIELSNISENNISTYLKVATTNDNIYSEEDTIYIEIKTGETKRYTIDTLNVSNIMVDESLELLRPVVYETDMREIEDIIAAKRENIMDIRELSDEYIAGEVETEENSLLYLPIIYDSNWKVTVDGEEQEIIRANGAFCVINLNAGKHSIVVEYDSKAMLVGSALSIVFLAGAAIVYALQRQGKIKVAGSERKNTLR